MSLRPVPWPTGILPAALLALLPLVLCGCYAAQDAVIGAANTFPASLILGGAQEAGARLFEGKARGRAAHHMGFCTTERLKAAADTRAEHKYHPDQGIRVKLLRVWTDPASARRRGTVVLLATYALLAPTDDETFQTAERRVVTFGGKTVAERAVRLDRTPGTYTSRVPLTLARRAPRGRYEVTVTVTATTTRSGVESLTALLVTHASEPLKATFTVR